MQAKASLERKAELAVPMVLLIGTLVLIAAASPPSADATTEKTTKVIISKKDAKPIDNLKLRRPRKDSDPPGSGGRVANGGVVQRWNIGFELKASTYFDDEGNFGDPDLIGIYIQKVRVKEAITWTCLDNGPDCSAGVGEWEFVEFDELHFSDYGLPGLDGPNGADECYKIPEFMRKTGAGVTGAVKDAAQLRAVGKGCFKLWMMEAYLVLPTHPNYEKIKSRLDAIDSMDKDTGKFNTPSGDKLFVAKPKGPKVGGTRQLVGFDGAGIVDSGNGVDDITEGPYAGPNGTTVPLDALINYPSDGLANIDPGNDLGTGGEGYPAPTTDSPDRRVPPISQWVYIEWDKCTGRRLLPPISAGPSSPGPGPDPLCELLEQQRKYYNNPLLEKDWIYRDSQTNSAENN